MTRMGRERRRGKMKEGNGKRGEGGCERGAEGGHGKNSEIRYRVN